MKTEIKEIQFYNDTLLGVKDEDDRVWLAIAHTCKELGFNERRVRQQGEKIRTDRVLSKGVRKFGLPTDGGMQDTFCIEEKFVPLWLAKITLTDKMERDIPKVFNKLERYQLEAADVLHKAFYETDVQKDEFHSKIGLEGEIIELKKEMMSLKENVKALIDNSTINKSQQNILYNLAKAKICSLLGGKGTKDYKKYSKLYFQNLWGDVKRGFECSGSYHDLNPKDYDGVKLFISTWNYMEL